MLLDLQVGSRGPEVGNWQRFLNERGCRDQDGRELMVDEAFGPRTRHATYAWQVETMLPSTGVVGPEERAYAARQGFLPFVQAKSFTSLWPRVDRAVRVIVVHTMENDEKNLRAAEDVALWFAGRTRFEAPRASSHYNVDQNSVVQSVRESDVAWHAPGVNHDGIGIEHAGRARQLEDDWEDDASRAILERSARLAAKIARRHYLPIVRLSPVELRAGARGFCGHHDATIAYPAPNRTHWDPGPGFPWKRYLDLVNSFVG